MRMLLAALLALAASCRPSGAAMPSGGGGWWSDDSIGGADHPCSIERRSASAVSAEEFAQEFDLQQPLILTNATAEWGISTAAFSREALLGLGDDAHVLTGTSATIPKARGAGHRKVP
eukprot:COSAG04_NODE_5523_length_1584_cov_1.567677_1_plen_117_part_10